MGIHDRDYMKRRPDDDERNTSSPDARLEAILSGFLSRYPRLIKVAGISLAALVVIAIVMAMFGDTK